MYDTKTFSVKGNPFLAIEAHSINVKGHDNCIKVKILKRKSNECFDITINNMRKFNLDICECFIFEDEVVGKRYEYVVFAAGDKSTNKIVIIDTINMTYSVTSISGCIDIKNIGITMEESEYPLVRCNVTLIEGYGNTIMMHFSTEADNFDEIFGYIMAKLPISDFAPAGARITHYFIDGTISGYSTHSFKLLDDIEGLEYNNKNRKEVETMPSKKNETKAAAAAEVNANTEPAKKEEPTPREIISQYAEAYDNMTKDAIRGNEVFGLLSPEHRLSIAAHLDQIVEILEGYIK